MRGTTERGERGGDHRDLIDRRRLAGLLEPAGEPASACASAALAIVRRDQRAELDRFTEVDVTDLAGGLLGDHEVPPVERTSEDGSV
jgi:hypothetical protein